MSKSNPDHLACSFCAKHADDVAALVVGPQVYICSSCVEICRETLANEYPDYEPLDSVQEVHLPGRPLAVSEVIASVAKYHFETKVRIRIKDEQNRKSE